MGVGVDECAGSGQRGAGSGPCVCNTRGSVGHRERVGGLSGERECAGWDTLGLGGEGCDSQGRGSGLGVSGGM